MELQLQKMLQMQDNLNTETSGENWREGVTNKGKIINWRRCMYMELAEAIDSISWKHWKNIDGNIDLQNLQIEMVDIWHFLMSELLRLYSVEQAAMLLEKNSKATVDLLLPTEWRVTDNLDINKHLAPFERFMSATLHRAALDAQIDELIICFFQCLKASRMDFETLYKLYIGKNTLNKFRQDHGYKEGSYKKIWNGKEDNVVMQELLESLDSVDSLYIELEKIYKTL